MLALILMGNKQGVFTSVSTLSPARRQERRNAVARDRAEKLGDIMPTKYVSPKKAFVKGHTRKSASGKITRVKPRLNKTKKIRTKK